MLDKLYPAITYPLWALLISAILILVAGTCGVVLVDVPLPGRIIFGLTVVALASILGGSAIVSIVARRDLRKKVIAVHRGILFVDECGYSDSRPLRSVLHMSVIPVLDRLAGALNVAMERVKFSERYGVSDSVLDSLIVCRIRRKGAVIFRWGSVTKKVQGLAHGNLIEVEWNPDFVGSFPALVAHEIGHILLDQTPDRKSVV